MLHFYNLFLEANSRKKKVYEQQENEENPLRCPVKLYEFYLSKWYVFFYHDIYIQKLKFLNFTTLPFIIVFTINILYINIYFSPESVKTRNDVFYLLPERSCVPDSPVWYSTSPLAKEHLVKMLYRVKMVKEINVALLTS